MLNRRADKLELLRIAEAVALEKSIDKELIINSMETGIAKAARSKFGSENEIVVNINRDNGDIEIYRKLSTRIVELHPITLAQNARTSGGGNITLVPEKAITVGPVQTWKSDKVSIWQAGTHDNPFGQRLTALMISKGIADSAVPMSLLADHPNVQFNYYRGGLGSCEIEMH